MTLLNRIAAFALWAELLAEGTAVSHSGEEAACASTPDAPVTACLLQGKGDLKKAAIKRSNVIEEAPAKSGLSVRESIGRWMAHKLRSDQNARQPNSMMQKSTKRSDRDVTLTTETSKSQDSGSKGHVSHLFTWGAPGSLTFAHNDKVQPNECFPGIRYYRVQEDYQDFPAESTHFFHPKMNLLVLEGNSDESHFHPCPEENFGQVTWPDRYKGKPSVDIHSGTELISHTREVYENWINVTTWVPKPGRHVKGVTPDRESEVQSLLSLSLSAGGLVDDLTVWIPTGSMAKVGFDMLKEGIPQGGYSKKVDGVGLGPDWRLVGAGMLKDPHFFADYDWSVLVQNVKSLDCILTFDSADLTWNYEEQRLALHLQKEDFCGCKECAHAGFLQELRGTVQNEDYQESIGSKLPYCNNVAVTGYSIGGATADLFTYCANSGAADDPDYKLISWAKKEPKLMDELTEDEFVGKQEPNFWDKLRS